jgi:hypothetical protein
VGGKEAGQRRALWKEFQLDQTAGLAVVAAKSPAEADEYRDWLTTLAQKASEASKEGGFLGIGGKLVSEEEAAAVKELSSALGKSAKA